MAMKRLNWLNFYWIQFLFLGKRQNRIYKTFLESKNYFLIGNLLRYPQIKKKEENIHMQKKIQWMKTIGVCISSYPMLQILWSFSYLKLTILLFHILWSIFKTGLHRKVIIVLEFGCLYEVWEYSGYAAFFHFLSLFL